MVLKFISATEAKTGTNILLDGEPFTVKKIDISKTGKHGGISVMDLESFETLEVPCSEELKSDLSVNDNVEYWDIEGRLIVKRKL